MDIKSIRVAKWNVNGLIKHKAEAINFLQYNKHTDRTAFNLLSYSLYYTIHSIEEQTKVLQSLSAIDSPITEYQDIKPI